MINWLAVVIMTLAMYVIGMAWYSKPLFGNQWMKLSGITEAKMKKVSKAKMMQSMVGALFSAFVFVAVVAYFIQLAGAVTFGQGALIGFYAWLGFLATTMLNGVFWKNEPWALYFLGIAHYLVVLIIVGGVLAIWV